MRSCNAWSIYLPLSPRIGVFDEIAVFEHFLRRFDARGDRRRGDVVVIPFVSLDDPFKQLSWKPELPPQKPEPVNQRAKNGLAAITLELEHRERLAKAEEKFKKGEDEVASQILDSIAAPNWNRSSARGFSPNIRSSREKKNIPSGSFHFDLRT